MKGKESVANKEAKDVSEGRCNGDWLWSLVAPWSPPDGDLTTTHVIYLVLVLFGAIGSSVFSVPAVTTLLGTTRVHCTYNTTCYIPKYAFAVHRIGFVNASFFAILILVFSTMRVITRSSVDIGLHTGVWVPKAVLLALLGYTAFATPYSIIDTIYGWFEILAWVVFSAVQLAFVVDLARSCGRSFTRTPHDGTSIVLKSFTWITAIVSVASTALLYAIYGHAYLQSRDTCPVHLVLISVNLLLCITILMVTCARTRQAGSTSIYTGLFQAGFQCLYVTYLTSSALMHGRALCARDPFEVFGSIAELGPYMQALVGVVFMCIILSYAFLRNPNREHLTFNDKVIANEINSQTPEQKDAHSYSWPLAQVVLLTASFYACATFVRPDQIDKRSSQPISWVFLAVKSITSVFTAVVYLWIIIAPIVSPDSESRDFMKILISLVRFFIKILYKLFFEACPGLNQSTSTRFVYTFFFLCGTIASSFMYLPSVRQALGHNRFFCSKISRLGNCMSHDPGYLAVYRICLTMATFYILFAVVLYNVRTYADPRALIQNGLWVVKFGLFFGLLVCTFFIPLEFSRVWTYVGLLGTFFFIVMQMILLVDFTRVWNASFARRTERTGKRIWFHILVFTTVTLYVISGASVVCFYMFFVGSIGRCRTNKTFITMNLVLCGIASLVSIHPVAADTGLLQAATVTFFTMYLTLSGLSYNPNEKCNPAASFISEADMRPNVSVQAVLDLILTIVFLVYFSCRVESLTDNLQKLVAATFQLLAGLRNKEPATDQEERVNDVQEMKATQEYTSTDGDTSVDKSGGAESLTSTPGAREYDGQGKQTKHRSGQTNTRISSTTDLNEAVKPQSGSSQEDEEAFLLEDGVDSRKNQVPYSYTFYHMVYFLGSLHVTMVLTNWYTPKNGSEFKLMINWAAMCIKLTASSMCVLLYIWSIVVPIMMHKPEENNVDQ
ncbi:uncharacterized protein LOC5513004 [Nematostella vectensis]|uniref:uncharacterized protein LOC5513004 n=1 Tax=Nematostella vectensis TaxID=45351 RepID=UPI0013905C61|nr:uncharacterized protein LOC5513004 [Nematostella vectensis]